MAVETYTNKGSDTLNGAINNSVTSLVVHSASSFPSTPYFRILIDTELLLVTAVSGTTFTVTRGVESTSAASHADAASVTEVVTAVSLQNIIDQRISTTKVAGDFGTVNGGDATITSPDGAVLMEIIARTASFRWCLNTFSFSGAAIIAGFEISMSGRSSDHIRWGFGLRYSGDGSLSILNFDSNSGGVPVLLLSHCTGPTSEGTTILQTGVPVPTRFWIKIEEVSTTLNYYLSNNGKDFVLFYSEAASVPFGGNTPDQVVWGGGNWTDRSTDASIMLRLIDWR